MDGCSRQSWALAMCVRNGTAALLLAALELNNVDIGGQGCDV